ncbi:MAG TPA: glycosyltransferase, partial [Terracidiphilus sp.]
MSAAGLWKDIGRGENLFTQTVRFLFLAFTALVFYFFAVLPLAWPQQVVCGLLFIVIGIAIAGRSDSYVVTLTLMVMSLFCTFRYGYWRISTMVEFFRDPSNKWGMIDVIFMMLLLGAEIYAFVVMALGYFQTIWPLRRTPVALPDDTGEWPHIDVLVPTYNEPLDVVRYTVLGALNLDWPEDKLHVYLLDDGRRKEFEEFAREAGVGYKI